MPLKSRQVLVLLHVLTALGIVLAGALAASAQPRGAGAVRRPKLSAPEPISLNAAQAAGWATVRYASLGGSSGAAMTVTVTRTAKAPRRPLTLEVATGMRLRNVSGQQDMVIARLLGRFIDREKYEPKSEILLPDDNPRTYVLDVYCVEAQKPNPDATSNFGERADEADPIIACILRLAILKRLSTAATQAAVWIVTDRLSFEQVSEKIELRAGDWENAVAVVNTCESRE